MPRRTKIEPMVQVANTIETHAELILNYIDAKGMISARIVEAGEGYPHAAPLSRADFDGLWRSPVATVTVARLGGRWICRNCGKLYHERNDPPKAAGVCDACGGQLYQREDDRPEVVQSRLEKQKPPAALIEHYRKAGVLKEIDGEQSLDAVTTALLEAIR